MKVAITGANGFIGQRLTDYFLKSGSAVRALTRNKINLPAGCEHFAYDLSKPVSAEALRGVDVLIHCAHANDASMISGTKLLIQKAKEARVRRIVFISSMAAAPDSLSEYGRSKFEIEKALDSKADLILRPGLVLGQGGLFGRISKFIRRSPVVPLIGGGQQPIRTVHVDDLVKAVGELITLNQSGLFQIASAPSFPLKELYLEIAERMGSKKLFVNVPLGIAEGMISTFELLKIPLPVNKENFLGLKQLGRLTQAPQAPLSFQLRDFKASLDDLLRTTTT